MILIADSGATKTDWRIIDKETQILQAKTKGISPYYQSKEEILKILRDELLPQINTPIQKIFFYGTGCSAPDKIALVQSTLQAVFSEASVTVNHDLLAAARSLCGHNEGIACILGTGSNSCLYDGENIIPNSYNLGFILGDEGSGAHLGKQLIVDFLHRRMPTHLWDKFQKQFPTNRDEVLENVYNRPAPSRYLASFTKFLFQHIQSPYCYQMVYQSFKAFFERYVEVLDTSHQYKVHFTGAIAFYYGNILRQVAQDLHFNLGNIIETPIAGLTLYHLEC